MAVSAEEALKQLKASILFDSGFPQRNRLNYIEYSNLSESEQREATRPSACAIHLARHQLQYLDHLVRELLRAKYEPAVPVLTRLWHECALLPVRTIVGHALIDIATPDAFSALEAMIDDYDHLSRHLAVKAIFVQEPYRAFERFESGFEATSETDAVVPLEVLQLLAPSAFEGDRPLYWLSNARDILKTDKRWLDLCASLRRDEIFGEAARAVLRYASQADRAAALSRARAAERAVPLPAPPRTKAYRDLPARYRAGEFVPVWQKIRAHENIDGPFRDEVMEVARGTMMRVRDNADLIAGRLRGAGWKAFLASTGDLRTVPSEGDDEIIKRISEITGSPVPPSLLAFWQVVGGINWVWDYHAEEPMPDLGVGLAMDEMDPLCVYSPSVVTYLFDEWRPQKKEPDPDLVEPFSIDLAPDVHHKSNVSGGAPYAIELPFRGADPLFANEENRLPFVDYLRLCFRWAGFPKLREHADRRDVRQFVAAFGKDVMPF